MLSVTDRYDSWQNLLSGIGSSRDKATYNHFVLDKDLPFDYIEQLYLNDDIASRIIDLVPNEIIRQGFLINGEQIEDDFKLKHHLLDALIKARLFGASFIYLGIDDGLEQHKPIKKDNIKSLKFLNVVSAKDVKIKTFYKDALQKDFGLPETYELVQSKAVIHESRLIPFYGTKNIQSKTLPKSILQRIYPVLQQFNTAWQSTAHLMSDASQGVFKLKGLHSSMSSNRSHELLKRMELIDMSRSVSRSVLLDAEDEDFRRDSYSFAGIPDILDKLILRLSAAAKIPVSLLMGQAPAGLNATGDSDIRFFYDQVKAEQEILKPKIESIYKLITGTQEENIKIDFPALWQLTDKEQAELKRTQAETDRIYLQEGVLLPEEIALMRFADLNNNRERKELLASKEEELHEVEIAR